MKKKKRKKLLKQFRALVEQAMQTGMPSFEESFALSKSQPGRAIIFDKTKSIKTIPVNRPGVTRR